MRAAHDQLAQLWGLLWVETERRQLILDAMYQAQQYFFDTAEVEAWLSEQELHMMNEEKGKVCVCVVGFGIFHLTPCYQTTCLFIEENRRQGESETVLVNITKIG